jgi:hypothetical protein
MAGVDGKEMEFHVLLLLWQSQMALLEGRTLPRLTRAWSVQTLFPSWAGALTMNSKLETTKEGADRADANDTTNQSAISEAASRPFY